MFRGVDHIGVGVSDFGASLRFYKDQLGFNQVMFEYEGSVPGIEQITKNTDLRVRIVMLRNPNTGPVGQGMIKLVNLLPPNKPAPIPRGTRWGEIGISEICVNASNVPTKFEELVIEKGCKALMPPASDPFPPHNTVAAYAYVSDPDGGKVELIDWIDMCPGITTDPIIRGVNHVAFGVSNMDVSVQYYKRLGFTDSIFNFQGYLASMAIWFEEPTQMKITMLANNLGAGIEPIQQIPITKDLRGNWGHLGPMEFAIGVTNLEKAYEELTHEGVHFICSPQTLEGRQGELKYAYLVEPDGLYVSLVEPRY
jgi:catechol 2,3-dioxygenase-like lactoylglutathione lyase family enzyme